MLLSLEFNSNYFDLVSIAYLSRCHFVVPVKGLLWPLVNISHNLVLRLIALLYRLCYIDGLNCHAHWRLTPAVEKYFLVFFCYALHIVAILGRWRPTLIFSLRVRFPIPCLQCFRTIIKQEFYKSVELRKSLFFNTWVKLTNNWSCSLLSQESASQEMSKINLELK